MGPHRGRGRAVDRPFFALLQRIDYGGVVNRHPSFGKRRPLVVLMTTLFVTHRDNYFNDGGHLAARHR